MSLNRFIQKAYRRFRVKFYQILSDRSIRIEGKPFISQAVLFKGKGLIKFGHKVVLGYNPSPGYYDNVGYLECRKPEALISIGDNVVINNSVRIVADKGSISIAANTLIGDNVRIVNSDFHSIDPMDRLNKTRKFLYADIAIGSNVWIGSDVTITKGVTIGDNSVIGIGSLVTKDIPSNSLAVGVPAKVIKEI